MTTLWDIAGAFIEGFRDGLPQPCLDREMRESLNERQIDQMISDSFPASDPPSVY